MKQQQNYYRERMNWIGRMSFSTMSFYSFLERPQLKLIQTNQHPEL